MSHTGSITMAAAYLFNYNCIWFVNIFFDRWGHSKLTTLECYQKVLLCVVLIAQISHYGKFTVLRKLLSIALESSIQIN